MASKSRKPSTRKVTEVQIRWNVDKSITTLNATNIVLQTNINGIYLSFFEALSPILIGSAAEIQEKINNLGPIEANCVARIFVTPAKFREFVGVLNQGLQRLETSPGSKNE